MFHLNKIFVFLIAFLGISVGINAEIRAKSEIWNGREIFVYAPTGIKENAPLLISCHGMGQDPAYQSGMAAWEDKADKEGFVVVYPKGEGNAWDLGGTKDINLIGSIIDKMSSRYKIDRSRVYLSGFSMGGMFTHFAATKIADKIAAFAPVSGYPIDALNFSFKALRSIPIMHTNGDADAVVHYEEWSGTFNGMNQHQMGAYYVMKKWAEFNQCNSIPEESMVGNATRYTWKNCANGVEVILNKIPDKGHWHSNDMGFNTTDRIWEFVSRFSLAGNLNQIQIPANRDTIFNSQFGDSLKLAGWNLNVWSGNARLNLKNGEAEVDISSAAEAFAYQIQMVQNGLHFEQGNSYQLTFSAYSVSPREIEVNIEMDNEPWTSYLRDIPKFQLSAEKKTYEVKFTMEASTDTNGRIAFNLGQSDANVFLDDITLKRINASEIADDTSGMEKPLFITEKFSDNRTYSYEIYDISGKLRKKLKAKTFADLETKFQSSELKKGVYLVKNKIGFKKLMQVK